GVTHIPAESEIYGLKIRHLISPTGDTWVAPLQAWLERERAARFANDNENVTARLGLVGAVSFLGLLAALILPSAMPPADRTRRLRAGGIRGVAAVLLATIGGIGGLFSLFVTADVRSYNRISPFIAFFSVAGLALWLDRPRAWLTPRVRVVLITSILIIGL